MWNFALEAFTVVTRGKLKITVSLADALRVTACNLDQDNCQRRRNDVLSLFREVLDGTQDESLLQEAHMRLGSFYTDKGEYDAARSELDAQKSARTPAFQLSELRISWIDIQINEKQLIRNTALDRYANLLVNIKWKATGKAEDSTLERQDLRKAHGMYHELFDVYSSMSSIAGVSDKAKPPLPYLSIRVAHYGNQMRFVETKMKELGMR
ncbi:hypothetical protein BDP55DRAFT_688593 [Colletotrichum godetiae]|uniref:Uncharacterized protein n=1 Tax=Colletotrichum godetiae TaxID=1209918 RepID=A0AAJ0A4Y4_9PEZI|nr:uncharacterized protein BDP55DRAFT_688593 [Colletotrichum godetiae]KAK1656589.1 hypothetical protein BDP55DRAFT_688593 [Colletotrichum godetiae]